MSIEAPKYIANSVNTFGTALLNPSPPRFDRKIVYPYKIEVADSESDLGMHGSSSFKDNGSSSNRSDMYFSIKRYFFALLFEKMHLLIYTLKVNTYIHPQSSKYLHTNSK